MTGSRVIVGSEFLGTSPTPELQSEKDLLRWLTAIARNRIRDTGRRRRARAFESLSESFSADDIAAVQPSPPSGIAVHEDALRLVEGLERLKEDYREVIELHDLEGLRLKEVAAKMGRSYDAIKQLHTRAMVELAGVLAFSDA